MARMAVSSISASNFRGKATRCMQLPESQDKLEASLLKICWSHNNMFAPLYATRTKERHGRIAAAYWRKLQSRIRLHSPLHYREWKAFLLFSRQTLIRNHDLQRRNLMAHICAPPCK